MESFSIDTNNKSISVDAIYQTQLQSYMNNDDLYDPFLKEGGDLVYDEQHNFVICMHQKPNQVQTLKSMQTLRIRILMTENHGLCKNIRIQLISDTQLYFNFIFGCSDWEFKRIKQNQNMFIEFKEYPEVVVKSFIKLKDQKQKGKYLGVFTIFTQNEGRLDIIRNAEFKNDKILQFEFFKPSEEQVKESIQYRYDLMKKQNQFYNKKYQEITEMIKAKNPSLMLQIGKSMRKPK